MKTRTFTAKVEFVITQNDISKYLKEMNKEVDIETLSDEDLENLVQEIWDDWNEFAYYKPTIREVYEE